MGPLGLFTIFVIAVALAMDAFAAAVVEGAAYKRLHIRHALRVAVLFGLFQALMPVAGYFCGTGLKGCISTYDHWVAFGLLVAVGVKMVYESTKIGTCGNERGGSGVIVLLALSVATSIDALVVGITLGLMHGRIIPAAVVIGLVTFVLSYAGVCMGRRLGHCFESKIEALGGIVLIVIGVKILLGHLFGG